MSMDIPPINVYPALRSTHSLFCIFLLEVNQSNEDRNTFFSKWLNCVKELFKIPAFVNKNGLYEEKIYPIVYAILSRPTRAYSLPIKLLSRSCLSHFHHTVCYFINHKQTNVTSWSQWNKSTCPKHSPEEQGITHGGLK